jgi:hypothetical protein
MIINEEGKLINLPLNVEATALWRATFTKSEYITGYDDMYVVQLFILRKKALKRWAALTGAALRACGAARHQ